MQGSQSYNATHRQSSSVVVYRLSSIVTKGADTDKLWAPREQHYEQLTKENIIRRFWSRNPDTYTSFMTYMWWPLARLAQPVAS